MRVLLAAILVVAFAPVAGASPWTAWVPQAAVPPGPPPTEVDVAVDLPPAPPAPAPDPIAVATAPTPEDAPSIVDAANAWLAPALGTVPLPSDVAPMRLPLPLREPVMPDVPAGLAPRPDHPASTSAASASGSPLTPSAAATAGGLALVWIAFEKLGLARALVAMYFRVQPGELLEHERRERVLTLIRERPGIGPSDIADDLGTGWGVTSYHLDRLERAGLVASQRVGHHRCYFVPGAVPKDRQRTVGLFRADTTRRIAELVARSPGIAQSRLCQELGLSASAASKQLSRLEAASLVRREPMAGALRVFPTAALSAAM